MELPFRHADQVACNTRGAALPLALVGLVLVSVLMTAVLLSSTTEGAASRAQRDAVAALYTTESALEQFVAQTGTAIQPATDVVFGATGPNPVRIDVARLYFDFDPANDAGDAIYSVRAEPTRGGRAVVAMVRVPYRRGLNLAPTSALTSAAPQLSITGSSIVSGKQNRNLCTTGADSVDAVTLTTDVQLDSARTCGAPSSVTSRGSITTAMNWHAGCSAPPHWRKSPVMPISSSGSTVSPNSRAVGARPPRAVWRNQITR